MMDVEHEIGKLLVQLSQSQDDEIGMIHGFILLFFIRMWFLKQVMVLQVLLS